MRALRLLVLGCLLYVGYTRLVAGHIFQQWAVAPITAKSMARVPDSHRILQDVNAYRRHQGLAPLHYSTTCEAAARLQVQYNAKNGTCTHDQPAYPVAGDRLQAVGHRYKGTPVRWGENVFRYTLSRDSQHSTGWHVFHCYHISSHHDQQMLDTRATQFGTASIVDAHGVLYNAEVFAN